MTSKISEAVKSNSGIVIEQLVLLIALKNILLKLDYDTLYKEDMKLTEFVKDMISYLIDSDYKDEVTFYFVLETLWIIQLLTCGDEKLVTELVREKTI